MVFDEYIKKLGYYKSKGKGISIYDCPYSVLNEIIKKFETKNINYKLIRLSEKFNTHLVDSDIKKYELLIIHQDVPINRLKININFINKLIYTSYYKNIPIIFISKLPKSKYIMKIKGSSVHRDYGSVINNLLIEQIVNLLEMVNITFTSPDLMNHLDSTFYTPIERIFKEQCEVNKIDYEPQVHFEKYFVDFVVNYNGNKAIVECDGRDYHNPNLDKERDKALSKFGLPIFHFSGSELFYDANHCLQKVIQEITNNTAKKLFSLDNNLDDSQLKAVEGSIIGPIRVLAPAGSGKTKILTNRIVHLINMGINPNQILALAFNKRAAQEIVYRLNQKGIITANKLSDEGVVVKTFHSLGYEIIRDSLEWSFNEATEAMETKKLMFRVVKKIQDIPNWSKNDIVDRFLEALRRTKLELLPIENLPVDLEKGKIEFGPYFEEYLKLQFKHNFFNFDDMIYLALRIILEDNVLRKTLQNKFNFILIDEFQDLNQAQILLMQILALPANNLFIVGDDDQMIYGFAGARVEHIVNFTKKYSFAKDFTLSTNYRSAKKIVKHSSWLIKHNSQRVDKNIKPYTDSPEGELSISLSKTLFDQAIKAVSWIKKTKEKYNYNWKDFTVLFRYYEYQYPIALVLDTERIPHSSINSQKLFKKNPGRDIYSYLTVILHPDDASSEDFKRILKRPNKYFKNNVIESARNWKTFKELENIQNMETWKINRIKEFVSKIITLQGYSKGVTSAYDLIQAIVEEFNLKNFYTNVANIRREIDVAADDTILEVILSVSKAFDSIDSFYEFIHDQITNPDAVAIPELSQDHNQNEILLSTIHKTKGNEFKNVVFFNLAENKKIKSLNEEEERRICYVGITRATERIFITAPEGNYSRFLPEILKNPELINYSIEELNEKSNNLRFNLNNLKNVIDYNEKRIASLQEQFPELLGQGLQINIDLFTRKISLKIDYLYKKYPELKGASLKTFTFFGGLLSDIRIKRIKKAQEEIEKLKKEEERIVERLKNERIGKVNEAKNKINIIKENNLNLKKKIVEINKEINEIENEIYYRNLLSKKVD